MKKLLLSLVMVCMCCGMASAETFTLVMGDQWGAADCTLTEWTQLGFTFTPALGGNTKDKVPAYKTKNKEVRFYALNTLTISVAPGSEELNGITFTLSKQGREEQAVITASTGSVDEQTVGGGTVGWSGHAQTVTFTVGATNSLHTEGIADGSGQLCFTRVEIVTGTGAVAGTTDGGEAPAEYYTLEGVRVRTPAPGVYICRQGEKVRKVVVR